MAPVHPKPIRDTTALSSIRSRHKKIHLQPHPAIENISNSHDLDTPQQSHSPHKVKIPSNAAKRCVCIQHIPPPLSLEALCYTAFARPIKGMIIESTGKPTQAASRMSLSEFNSYSENNVRHLVLKRVDKEFARRGKKISGIHMCAFWVVENGFKVIRDIKEINEMFRKSDVVQLLQEKRDKALGLDDKTLGLDYIEEAFRKLGVSGEGDGGDGELEVDGS